MSEATSNPRKPRALVGWRLLALFYDFWPMFAVWMVVGAVFVAAHGDAVRGGWLGFLEFIVLWLVTGLYATYSWRYGGQTLGMRPWRLRVVMREGQQVTWKALWLRYAIGNLSLLLGGLGFWWAWFDRDGLTWHDRISNTRTSRIPKAKS